MKNNIKLFTFLAPAAVALLLAFASGCSDTTTTPTNTYIDNPNVKAYDSIEVFEDSTSNFTHTGMNLLTGVNTVDTDPSRDCSLNDLNNAGVDFFLQNGQTLDNVRPAGYEIRFFQVSTGMSSVTFDTLSKVQGYTTFSSLDFTQNGTDGFGSYFNAPLTSTPVYCFWLKGRKDAVPSSSNIYGIIQPREATDRDPSGVYGFRMSFRVRININGENDFRRQILQTQ